jgi:hypothetical protein
VLVDVETWLWGCLEGSEVGLYSFVKFFGKLPDRFVCLGVEVVVLLEFLIVEDLEGINEFVYLLGIHLF